MYLNKLLKLIMCLLIMLSGFLIPLEQSKAEEIEGTLNDTERTTLINKGFTEEEISEVLKRKNLTGLVLETAINIYPHTAVNISKEAVSDIKVSKSMPNVELTQFTSNGTSSEDGLKKLRYIKTGENQAPFSIGDDYENISTLDGSLSIMEEDLTLVGRNGLSFDLKRTYSTNQAQYYDMTIDEQYYTAYKYSVEFDTEVYKETQAYVSKGEVYNQITTHSCKDNSLKNSFNVDGTPRFSGAYYTKSAAVKHWVQGTKLGSGAKDDATCAKTGNKTYDRYTTFAKGTNTVYEDSSQNLESPASRIFPDKLDGFDNPAEAEIVKNDLKNGKYFDNYFHSSIWYGTDSSYRYLYVVGNNPSPTVKSYAAGTEPEYTNKTSKSFIDNKFPLGKGWTWDIPYIQNENNSTILHFGDRGSYEIVNNQLKGYPWKDLTFTLDATQTVNQVSSKYAVKTLEGTTYYFSQSGNLLKIKDSYDNYIQFKYSTHPLYKEVLSEIENSINNKISIAYSETEVRLTQGDKVVIYSKQKSPDGKVEILKHVDDQMGRKTTYDYNIKEAKFNLLGTTPFAVNPYVLLVGITHPTGLKTDYSYEGIPFKKNIGNSAVNETYRVLNRNDGITYNNGEKLESNLKSFNYDPNMNGYYSNSYTYTTKITEKDKITSYVINRKYDSIQGSANYYKLNEISEDSTDSKLVLDFVYESNKHNPNPIKTTKTFEKKSNSQKSILFVTETQYNDYGQIISERNELGFQSRYEYDPNTQLLTGITEPLTSTKAKYTKYERNAKGSITKETIYENNSLGKVLSNTIYGDYDAYGNSRSEVTTSAGKTYTRTFDYGPTYSNAFLTKEIRYVKDLNSEEKQLTVQASYYPETGNLKSIIDGKGNITGYQYDKLDRLTTITHPDSSTLVYMYNDENNRIETKDELGNITFEEWNPIGWKVKEGIKLGDIYDARSVMHYNETGDLISSSNALGQETQYEYDFMNRITKETNPLGNARTTQYDDILNLQTLTDEEGNRVTQNFDAAGRTIKDTEFFTDSNRTKEFTYDNMSNVLTEKDAKGRLTYFEYDVLGNLVSVTMPNGEITRYEYDYLGNVMKVTYPDHTFSSKKFDESGRMLSKTDINQKSSTYQYDNNDQLIQSTDRNGNQHKYVYNNRNWLTKVDTLKENIIVDTVEYEYYLNGARKSMDDATGLTKYAYNLEGNMLDMVYPDGKSISYQYDKKGNKKEIVSPFNKKIVYEYNEQNLIKKLGVEEDPDLVTYDYLANGQLQNKNQANGLTSFYTFNHSNLTEVKQLSSLGEVLNNGIYQYDLNKNIEEITAPEEVSSFTYDQLNRVESNSQGTETYEYDKKGNRSLLDSEKLPTIENRTYEYDSNNRLIKVTTDESQIEYRYNGDGLLYEKESGNQITRYYYDGDVLIAEAAVHNGQSVLKNHYVTGNDKELLIDAHQQLYFYTTDGLENIIELRDETGKSVNKYRYDMWGNPIITEEEVYNSLHYSGEVWEESTGLQYLRSRWYDPSLGRFLNEDSFEGTFDTPLSLNKYTYVEQNPLIYKDPTGEEKKNVGDPTIGGIGNAKVIKNPPKAPPKTYAGIPSQGLVGNVKGAPKVDAGKQGKHVIGHPNNTNKNKSVWNSGENGVELTQKAWVNGTTVKPDGSVRTFDFGKRIGPCGETKIKVHMDSAGNIHGYPVF
ncbi:RHS repeat-associated core domain-containing protein [Paenisporosarcina indica]|uniref:RHS repeat-associated core domain-containing protein n=1 Tax=Paenisporosarcina indica TaxID=650093 RepID=UPI00094F7502|nr:RHS repeat-associated core domain-containing protein [Paenisporosarcina indica]